MFLTILDGPHQGTTVKVDRNITVGRDADCEVVIDQDERASRRHAGFALLPDGTVTVTDLGSTNGVFIGTERVTSSATARSGDTIRVGRTMFGLRATDPASGPATVLGGTEPIAPPTPRTAQPVAAPAAPAPPPPGTSAPATPKKSRTGVIALAAAFALIVVGIGAFVATRGDDEPETFTAEEVTRRSARGVLQVQAEIDGQLIGTGTGWVYDIDRGLIATNYHVVGVGTEFSVGIGPDRRTASLVGAAPCDDLAILRVDRTDDLQELPLGDQSELANGQETVALGYPGTASQTPTLITSTGSISSPRTSFDAPALDLPRYPNLILTQTPINPGNSGGPLLDMQGRVIGINSAGSNVTQNQNYAIGVDRLREVLPKLSDGDSNGWTGLVIAFPRSPEEVERLGHDPALFGQAIFAVDAVPQSPAANTGLFRDLDGTVAPIAGIDGNAMDGTLQTYCNSVGSRQRGERTTLNITDGVNLFDFDVNFS